MPKNAGAGDVDVRGAPFIEPIRNTFRKFPPAVMQGRGVPCMHCHKWRYENSKVFMGASVNYTVKKIQKSRKEASECGCSGALPAPAPAPPANL